MALPPDPIAFVRTLHSAYEARTGYTIRWNMHRETQWAEWCRWSEWEWTELDLSRVIGYLRAEIKKGDRNQGALKFDNLIGQPHKFEEDLNLAVEAAKPNRMFIAKPAPAKMVAGQPVNSFGEVVESGAEAARRFRENFK